MSDNKLEECLLILSVIHWRVQIQMDDAARLAIIEQIEKVMPELRGIRNFHWDAPIKKKGYFFRSGALAFAALAVFNFVLFLIYGTPLSVILGALFVVATIVTMLDARIEKQSKLHLARFSDTAFRYGDERGRVKSFNGDTRAKRGFIGR